MSDLYVVTADFGDGPEPVEDEIYSDAAFAWQQAGEIAADDKAAAYSVYKLTPVERP